MRTPKTSKAIRTAAGVLGVMLLFAVLFSAFYIAAEADHDCCGEGCLICACVHQCQNILRQLGNGAAASRSAVIPVCVFLFAAMTIVMALCPATLVSGKVRLNN